MPVPHALTVWALGGSGIILASIGAVLAVTWAFPDVQCSGDACLITWNPFAIPLLLLGSGLGIASVLVFIRQRFGAAAAPNR